MRSASFALLSSFACFTLGTSYLLSTDYYVGSATTAGSPDGNVGTCTTPGNVTCTLQDAYSVATNGDTIHISPSTVTYTSAYTTPCTLSNVTIQSDNANGSIIDFGAFTSNCIASNSSSPTVFQPIDGGSITLDGVVFHNSNTGGNVISINGSSITMKGTTINGSAVTFDNNTWLLNQNSQILTFDANGDYTLPFSDPINDAGRQTLFVISNYAGTLTISSDVTGPDRDILNFTANGGPIYATGVLTQNGVTNSGGNVYITGSSNAIGVLGPNAGNTFIGSSISPATNAGTVFRGGTIKFLSSCTYINQLVLFTAGEDIIDDQGFNILITGPVVKAGGGGGSAIYAKYGSGVQELTNTSNNWSAGTNIYAGALSFSNILALGGTSPINFLGGSLFASVGLTLPSTITTTASVSGGGFSAAASTTFEIQSNITGSGTLNIGLYNTHITASGTVFFNNPTPANNTFSGSLVIGALDGFNNPYPTTLLIPDFSQISSISSMTLQGGGIFEPMTSFSMGSASINIGTGSGTFFIDTGIELTSSGIFSATSGTTLTKTGSGTLSLLPASAGSAPSFDVLVPAGDLISNTYVLGNATITTGASTTITFNQDFTGTFSGSIAGPADVIKEGSGTAIFSSVSSYTGKTYVNAGTLEVNGDISSSPDPIVAVGATLSGIGTVGTTIVSGTIAGGNPLGTLTVLGDLTLESGSFFGTTTNGTEISLVTVSGSVSISDTQYQLTIEPGQFSLKGSKVVLIGEGGVTGEFASIQVLGNPSGHLFLKLKYTATEVILNFQPVLLLFAVGGNAKQVAKTLDADPTGLSEVFTSLAPLATTKKRLTYALNQLHPAQLKGMTISQENNAVRVRESITQRILNELDSENCLSLHTKDEQGKECCDKNKKTFTFWVASLGDTLVQNTKTNAFGPLTGYRANTGGMVTGFDALFADHFYAGAIGAYTGSHLHFENGKGKGNITSGYAGIYLSAIGSGNIGKIFYANASVIGSWSEYDVDRHIQYGKNFEKVNLTAKSDHGGNQILSHFDTGLNFNYFGFTVRPFDSFDYMSQIERGYQESNAGQWELTITRKNAMMIRNELGLQFSKCLCFCSSKWIFSPKVSWVREVRIKGETFNVNFTQGGSPFVIHGYFPDRSLVAPGLAVTGYMLNDSLLLDLYYGGEFKGGYSSNSYGGQVGYRF